MSKISVLTLTGTSGKKYEFNVYPFDTNFKAFGAVYYVSKRTKKLNGGGSHSPIYIGQTSDMSDRFDNHHKATCFTRHDANCLSIHQEEDELERIRNEKDLIEAYDLPCNEMS